MSTTVLPRPPSGAPAGKKTTWRVVVAVASTIVVVIASVVVGLLLRRDSGPSGPAAGPSPTAEPAPPSGQPSTGGPMQPPAAGFRYQPLWPFGGVADATAWQQTYRDGGHQPWHLDARATALSFASGFLGYKGIDRVARETRSGSETWVTVGYADPNGATAAAAVVHLARIGAGADAPWEVVGTRDTTLTLTQPRYGATVASPISVGGRITGVDESLRVQVRALGKPLLGQVTGIPAGGERSPWSAQVRFAAPAGTVLTIAVSTGGHSAQVERFAITGVRAATSSSAVGTWRLLPRAPSSRVSLTESVWTGTEMLLFGQVGAGPGNTILGAGYNPATGRWRTLRPAPPIDVYEGNIRAVWTGSRVVVNGAGFNAAYDPAANSWRSLPGDAGSAGSGYSVFVWTGQVVLGWGGGCCGAVFAGGAQYDPASDVWRPLPPAPLSGRHAVGAWTGKELVLAGGNGGRGELFRDAAAYNPVTRTWRRLPSLPAARSYATATWTGSELLLVGGWGPPTSATGDVTMYPAGLAYSPATNRWRTLPAADSGRVDHVAAWTGRTLLVWGGRTLREGTWTTPRHGLAYDPSTNRWSALPTAPLRGRSDANAVWTGSQMIVWGGGSVGDLGTALTDGAAYTP
jgi:hypothetical protein